jgi:ligand-binding SRPBCC domain-containing protein
MSRSGERVVGGVRSGVMELGDTVTWRARHFGLPFTMTSRITDLVAPSRFVDEQVSGPFAHWWHEHVFEQLEETTLMTDTVEFTSPAGPIGRVIDAVILTSYMTRLLTQRNQWLVHALS